MLRVQTYLCLITALIAGTAGNQSCSSFDGLNYKLKPPDCSMIEIEARLKRNPTDAAALMDRAQAYLTAGECELAAQDYGVVIKHNPRVAKAYLGRSRALEMTGSHSQALLDIDQAIKIGDKACLADAILHKTAVLSALNRSAECPQLFEQLISRKDIGVGPSDRYVLMEHRAEIYLRLKKPELALLDLERCSAVKPGALSILLDKGKAYALLNQPDKELAAYTRGIAQDVGTRSLTSDCTMADLYLARSKVYKKMGKLSLAEADLKQSQLHRKSLYRELYEPDKDPDFFQKAK